MKLNFDTTVQRVTAAIETLSDIIEFEINCPVVPGVNTAALHDLLKNVQINDTFQANSRGGLIEDLTGTAKSGRFNTSKSNFCTQPSQNFNILADGSVISCCQDWMHESKKDFQNVNTRSLFEIYRSNTIKILQKDFISGDYSRYKMCEVCSDEMGFYKNKTSKEQNRPGVYSPRTIIGRPSAKRSGNTPLNVTVNDPKSSIKQNRL